MGIGRCDAGAIELRGRERQLVALGRRLGGGLLRLRARSRNGGCGGRCGRTARDRRFQEITPAEALIRHVFLPASGSTSWCQRSFLACAKMRLVRLRRQGCSVQDCFDPSRKLLMVWQRLRGCTVVPTPADWSLQISISCNSALVGRGLNAI